MLNLLKFYVSLIKQTLIKIIYYEKNSQQKLVNIRRKPNTL